MSQDICWSDPRLFLWATTTTTPPPPPTPLKDMHNQTLFQQTRTRRESKARTVPWWTVGVVLLNARAAVLALARKVGRRLRASRESMVVMVCGGGVEGCMRACVKGGRGERVVRGGQG